MILSLKNISKIKETNIELNGITVIAGENNSGKSTVGKILYAVFNSLHNLEIKIRENRIENIERILDSIYFEMNTRMEDKVNTEILAEDIINNVGKIIFNEKKLEEYIIATIKEHDENIANSINNEDFKELIERIRRVFAITDDEIFKALLTKRLELEFDGQVSNIFNSMEGYVELKIKDKNIRVIIKDNEVVEAAGKLNLQTETVYIDDPFILDESMTISIARRRVSNYFDHRNHLKKKLYFENHKNNIINELVTKNQLDLIYEKLNSICSGDVIKNKRYFGTLGYKKGDKEQVLKIKNISAGLKTFVILKTLLQNGVIEYNGTIILDEPEIHLHPEWQLVFAELIVLLQKEFNLHILLTTHSPYFLGAIEVYSAQYKSADKCKYYLSSVVGDDGEICDVTGNIEKIYSKLARPLQILENKRYSDD